MVSNVHYALVHFECGVASRLVTMQSIACSKFTDNELEN